MGLTAFVKKSTEDQQVKGIKKNKKKPAWTAMAILKNKRPFRAKKKKERVDKTSTKTEMVGDN